MCPSLKRKRAQFINFKIHKCWTAFALLKIEAFTPQQRRWNLSLSPICLSAKVKYKTVFLIWLELPNGELTRTAQSLKLWKKTVVLCRQFQNPNHKRNSSLKPEKGMRVIMNVIEKLKNIHSFISLFSDSQAFHELHLAISPCVGIMDVEWYGFCLLGIHKK